MGDGAASVTIGVVVGTLAQVATLTPGMALFIPSGWWHQVRASAGGVAISVPVVGQPLCSVATKRKEEYRCEMPRDV